MSAFILNRSAFFLNTWSAFFLNKMSAFWYLSVLYVEISIPSVGSSLKWTVLGQKGRSEGVKVDGPKGLKLDGLRKWTVPRVQSGRS